MEYDSKGLILSQLGSPNGRSILRNYSRRVGWLLKAVVVIWLESSTGMESFIRTSFIMLFTNLVFSGYFPAMVSKFHWNGKKVTLAQCIRKKIETTVQTTRISV